MVYPPKNVSVILQISTIQLNDVDLQLGGDAQNIVHPLCAARPRHSTLDM